MIPITQCHADGCTNRSQIMLVCGEYSEAKTYLCRPCIETKGLTLDEAAKEFAKSFDEYDFFEWVDMDEERTRDAD